MWKTGKPLFSCQRNDSVDFRLGHVCQPVYIQGWAPLSQRVENQNWQHVHTLQAPSETMKQILRLAEYLLLLFCFDFVWVFFWGGGLVFCFFFNVSFWLFFRTPLWFHGWVKYFKATAVTTVPQASGFEYACEWQGVGAMRWDGWSTRAEHVLRMRELCFVHCAEVHVTCHCF